MVHSLYELLTKMVSEVGTRPAVRYKELGAWKDLSWNDVLSQVHQIASKLIELGVQPGDRIVLLSKTRYEWSLADLGIMAAGGCTVPIYHSNLAGDAGYVYENSGAKMAIVEDAEQAAKLPNARLLFVADLLGAGINLEEIQHRTAKLRPDSLASIIYTSGTTGEPKGACLTHDNFLYEAQAIEKVGLLHSDDVQLLFLPLAHVFARVMQVAWIRTGHVMCYAESIDKVVDNMKEIQPTFMAAVPRIYEKVHARVLAKARSGGWLKKTLSNWAFAQQKNTDGLLWPFAKALVYKKVGEGLRETFGGNLRFFISGGAPLNPDVAWFFHYAGVTILEGYGLTETTAATCVNLPHNNHIGTVGRPLPGMELKIADDGEVCVRGRGVFKEYWKRPEQTAEVLDSAGWFKTGDIGVIQKGGFLKITDRKKDLIVTAGGKKVAPQKLEALLKSNTSLISQVLVCGDQRAYLVALVTLDEQALKDFAKRKKLTGTPAQLSQDPLVVARVMQAMQSMNQNLASFEQIKKIKILDHDFTVGDQLTPTLKVKRAYCCQLYQTDVDGLYKNILT